MDEGLIGTVFAKLGLDDKDYHTGIKQAETASSTMIDNLNHKFKQLAYMAATAFSTHAIYAYTKEATMLTARLETMNIVLGIIGKNAGYTSGAMRDYVQQVKSMGITTSAAQDSLTKMAQANLDLAKASQLARVSQDAAVIGNTNSSEAFQRMIYGIKTGQTEVLRTIGINISFEASYAKYGITLNKTAAALTEQEKTTARMNAVLAEGIKIQGAYEAAMSTTGKLIQSLPRYFEEVKEKVGELFSPALGVAVRALMEGLAGIGKTLEGFIKSGDMAVWAKHFADGFSIALTGVKGFGSALVVTTQKTWEFRNELLALGVALASIKIGLWISSITLAGTAFGSLVVFVKALTGGLGLLSAATMAFGATVTAVTAMLTKTNIIIAAISLALAAGAYAWATWGDTAKDAVTKMVEESDDEITRFKSKLSNMKFGVVDPDEKKEFEKQLKDLESVSTKFTDKEVGLLKKRVHAYYEGAELFKKLAKEEKELKATPSSTLRDNRLADISMMKIAIKERQELAVFEAKEAEIQREKNAKDRVKEEESLNKKSLDTARGANILATLQERYKREEDTAKRNSDIILNERTEANREALAQMKQEGKAEEQILRATRDFTVKEAQDAAEESKRQATMVLAHSKEIDKQIAANKELTAKKGSYSPESDAALAEVKRKNVYNSAIADSNKEKNIKILAADTTLSIAQNELVGKNLNAMVGYFKSIDQYSNESVNAQIEAKRFEYRAALDGAANNAEKLKIVQQALARDIEKIGMDSVKARYQIELDYIMLMKGTMSEEYEGMSENLLMIKAAEIAESIKLMGQEADAQKIYDQLRLKQEVDLNNAKANELEKISGMEKEAAVARARATVAQAQLNIVNMGKIAGPLKTAQDAIKVNKEWLKGVKDIDAGLSNVAFGDKMADGINAVVSALSEVNNVYQKQADLLDIINKKRKEAEATEDPLEKAKRMAVVNRLEADGLQAKIGAYRKLGGAASEYFEEGSRGRKFLHNLEMTLATVEMAMTLKKVAAELWGYATVAASAVASAGVQVAADTAVATTSAVAATANQGKGDPYTAFPRIAAMAAIMGGVLAIIGSSFNPGTTGAPSAAYGENTTVFGGENGQGSESISKSWELMQDTYDLQKRTLTGIYESMKELNENITGIVKGIVSGDMGNMTPGQIGKTYVGSAGTQSTLGSAALAGAAAAGSVYAGMASMGPYGWIAAAATFVIDKIFKIGIAEKIGGFLLGGAETSLIATGLMVGSGGVRPYAETKTETSGPFGGLFGGDRTSYDRIIGDIDATLTTLFYGEHGVYTVLKNNVSFMATTLGGDVAKAENKVFEAFEMNFIGKTPEEISKIVSGKISEIGDKFAFEVFGDLIKTYQTVGEGPLETASRLAIDLLSVTDILGMTGKTMTEIKPAAIGLSEELLKIAGGLEKLQEASTTYFDKFFSDVEKQDRTKEVLTGILSDVGEALPETRAGYRALVEAQILTGNATEALNKTEREHYVILLKAAEVADQYYSVLEEGAEKVVSVTEAAKKKEELELAILEMSSTEVENLTRKREKERIALGGAASELGELQQTLWDLQDAASALKTAEDALGKTRNLSLRLLTAQGDKEGALTITRSRELLAATSLDKLILEQIFAYEDLNIAQENLNKAQKDLADTSQKLADVQGDLVKSLHDTAKEIEKWISDMGRSQLAPVMSPAAFELEYAKQKALASAPGAKQEDISSFLSYAQNYLEFQKSFGTGGSYKSVYDLVMGDVKGLKSSVEAQIGAEELRLQTLQTLAESLRDVSDNTVSSTENIKAAFDSARIAVTAALTAVNNALSKVASTNTAADAAAPEFFKADKIYKAVLGREGESSEMTWWSNQLKIGLDSTKSMILETINSAEWKSKNQGDFIGGLYRSLLGREADVGGREYWQAQFNNNKSLWDIASDMMSSSEYSGVQSIRGFASGGGFGGGYRIVGERGPEIEYTGPSAIMSNDKSKALVDNVVLIEEVRKLRAAVERGNEERENTVRIDIDGREIGNVVSRQIPKNDDLQRSIRRVSS